MSTYPGENPQPPDGPKPENAPYTGNETDSSTGSETGSEETQPVGYWEQQAAERAREQVAPPPAAPVQNPWSQMPGANPYGPYAPGPQDPGGQPTYSTPPGSSAPYAYPPAPGGIPGQYAGYTAVAPAHPQSTLALVLGLVSLVGGLFVCGLPLLVSPFAWAIGRSSLKDIRESQGRLSGESNARAGMIMGIIGTVLLILAIVAVIAVIVLISVGTTSGSFSGTTV